jgi:hypothetical protein
VSASTTEGNGANAPAITRMVRITAIGWRRRKFTSRIRA